MEVLNRNDEKYVVFYDTMTFNTKFFCDKLKKKYPDVSIVPIKKLLSDDGYYKLIVTDNSKDIKYHLITYTIMQGEVPKNTLRFLDELKWKDIIKTIWSTGQKNWGDKLVGVAVDEVNKLYPNIKKGLKIELQGNEKDVDNFYKMIIGE